MAKVYLAYIKSSRPTGKFIAKQLGISSFGMNAPDEPKLDLLIRWGSRRQMPPADIEINNPQAIRLASDKLDTYQILYNVGLPMVYMSASYDDALKNSDGIVFGRNRTGFGGKDIVVYRRGERPTRHHDFYTPYYDAPREVRIHVVRDKIVRVQGKYLDFPEKAGDGFIKNYAHGYRFRSPKKELHFRRRQQAIDAVKALGLDFGAVDMLIYGDRDHLILEVNTAPACSPLTARCYAGEIALQVMRQTSGEIKLAAPVLQNEMDYIDEEGEE